MGIGIGVARVHFFHMFHGESEFSAKRAISMGSWLGILFGKFFWKLVNHIERLARFSPLPPQSAKYFQKGEKKKRKFYVAEMKKNWENFCSSIRVFSFFF